ncbi:hypothetical protein ALC60_08856 [Trachymyrmex zeteki]|uniref:Uncharacterized protein n=1 Tax=Mycetomoellerius zeteki TaxID=64791 RepID=A0A151WX45_9HYME|nr:hypothetical protein ALC60_08856 [Trachymyrmex zeteki]
MTYVSAGELVPPERHRGYFSRYHIARRAIISIRGITDVSSFHTVSTSRKLARSTLAGWLAVGPEETSQNLSSGNNRCTGAIQSLPASFGSAHQPNTFSRVVCLNLQCYTVQIFTHNSHFSIPESLFI